MKAGMINPRTGKVEVVMDCSPMDLALFLTCLSGVTNDGDDEEEEEEEEEEITGDFWDAVFQKIINSRKDDKEDGSDNFHGTVR